MFIPLGWHGLNFKPTRSTTLQPFATAISCPFKFIVLPVALACDQQMEDNTSPLTYLGSDDLSSVMYNSVRTDNDKLDSSAVKLYFEMSPSFRSMLTERCNNIRGHDSNVEEIEAFKRTMKNIVACDILYFDMTTPMIYAEDVKAMTHIDPPELTFDFDAPKNILIINVQRKFPLTSNHCGRPFRLGLLFDHKFKWISAPFCVMAKKGKKGQGTKQKKKPKFRRIPEVRKSTIQYLQDDHLQLISSRDEKAAKLAHCRPAPPLPIKPPQNDSFGLHRTSSTHSNQEIEAYDGLMLLKSRSSTTFTRDLADNAESARTGCSQISIKRQRTDTDYHSPAVSLGLSTLSADIHEQHGISGGASSLASAAAELVPNTDISMPPQNIDYLGIHTGRQSSDFSFRALPDNIPSDLFRTSSGHSI